MEKIPEDELPVKQKRSRKMTPELLEKLADARKKAAEIKKEMAGNVPAKVKHAKEKIKKERQHSKKHIKKLAEDELDKESNLVDLSTDAKILEKEDEATPKEPEPEEPQTEVAEAKDPVPEEKVEKPKKSKKPVIIEESSDEEEVVYVKKRVAKKKEKKVVEPETPPPSPVPREPEPPATPKWIKGVPPSLMKIRTCEQAQRRAIFKMI